MTVVAVAMEIVDKAHWCPLLTEFVKCDGRCRSCSVEYLRSRDSVAGDC